MVGFNLTRGASTERILTLITITIFRKIKVNVTQLQLKLGYNIIDKYSTTIICRPGKADSYFLNITNDGKIFTQIATSSRHLLLYRFRECSRILLWEL